LLPDCPLPVAWRVGLHALTLANPLLRLKKLLAESMLDNAALKDLLGKNV